MSELSEFVATIESRAASEYEKWIQGVGGYTDGLPESVKTLCRSFFIAGFYRGSAVGANAYHASVKSITKAKETATT